MTGIPKLPAILTLAACLAASGPATAQDRYETLHTFSGDKGRPFAGLVAGADGRLYGTTIAGGFFGKGSVFAADAAGNVETIHEFTGSDGAAPRGTLLLASDGNFYGTTSQGALGYGTIFKLTPGGPSPHCSSSTATTAHFRNRAFFRRATGISTARR